MAFASDHFGIVYDVIDAGMSGCMKMSPKARLATNLGIKAG